MQDGSATCDKTCNLKHHFFAVIFKGEGTHTMKRVAIFTTVNAQSCAVGYNLYAGTEPRERRHEVQGRYETGDDGVCTTVCTRIPSIDHSNMHSLSGVHSNTSCISQ